MKPNNILRFWFWRARLMVAGLHEGKDKIAKIQINDELSLELHPAADLNKRAFLKLCRSTDKEQQSLVIYLKEIPGLIDLLPRAVAQLMTVKGEQPSQRNRMRQMDIIQSRPELVD